MTGHDGGTADQAASGSASPAPGSADARWGVASLRRPELLLLLAILVLAALTRLPGIEDRGRWDADQGNHMLVLLDMVRHGTVPLLGPSTFAGAFHHGALYYWLLAPAAFVSDADPMAVTLEIALLGIAAVTVVWALGRELGGRWAGHLAGMLAAVSPALIVGSTFIWNPNPVPLGSALAFLGLVRAWKRRDPRWWLLAAFGTMIAMQLHVSGVLLLAPILVVYGVDLRRNPLVTARKRIAITAGCAAIIAAGFLPLLAYEVTNDLAETRAILEYVAGGGTGGGSGVLERIVLVGLRSITWPFAGLITDRPTASLAVAMIVALLGTLAVLGRRRSDRAGVVPVVPAGVVPPDLPATRWLAAGLGLSILLLAVFAPSLAVIVPELPNDHYHAFLDPIVLALVGVGLARLWTAGATRPIVARLAAAALTLALAGIAVTAWPPAKAPDGGWPLADDAAARILATTREAPILLDGIPPFKSADALRFPLVRRGGPVLAEDSGVPEPGAAAVVLVCDPLFDDVVGKPCGGPAEDAWLAAEPGRAGWSLAERFEAGSRRVISVYVLGTVPDASP